MFFPLGILWLGLTTWSFGLRVVDLLGISWVVASGLQAHANWDQNSYLNQLAGSDSGVDLRMHEAGPYRTGNLPHTASESNSGGARAL